MIDINPPIELSAGDGNDTRRIKVTLWEPCVTTNPYPTVKIEGILSDHCDLLGTFKRLTRRTNSQLSLSFDESKWTISSGDGNWSFSDELLENVLQQADSHITLLQMADVFTTESNNKT